MGKIHQVLIQYQQAVMDSPNLTPELKRIFRKIIDCRTIELGGHILRCPDLHAFAMHYNSCRQQGCPLCSEIRRLQWQKKKLKQLLPVEHLHLVFKLPAELSLLWLHFI